MVYIKLFESYFSDGKTWEEVSHFEFSKFINNHKLISNYGEAFDIFDEAYNLYQKDPDDFNNNQYEKKADHLIIYLVRRKIDIVISAFEDSWYTIKVCKFKDYSDDDYYTIDYYIADDWEGLNDWLQHF